MLYVQEAYVNKSDERRCYGESDVYEAFTDDLGELYRAMVREYGRCTGKVRIDTTAQEGKPVGWVFEKYMKYAYPPYDKYLQETWVTVHDAPPVTNTQYQYHAMEG